MTSSALSVMQPVGTAQSRSHRTPARYRAIAAASEQDARRLQRDVDSIIDPETESPALKAYRESYNADVGSAHPRSIMRRAEGVARAAQSDIVFCGDVHSSGAAQNVCRELLEQMQESRAGGTVVVLEIARPEHQPDLDAFIAGDIAIDTLMERLEFEESWGFPPAGYVALLRYAQTHGIKLVGGNTKGSLEARDVAAAETIADTAERYPDAKILVMFGQLHVGREHLPAKVERALGERDTQRTKSSMLTGDHPSYFELAKRGLYPQAARLDDDTFIVYANRPRASVKGYLRYLHDLLDD